MAKKAQRGKKEKHLSRAKAQVVVLDFIQNCSGLTGGLVTKSDIRNWAEKTPGLNGNVKPALSALVRRRKIIRVKDGYKSA